jgi:hypothetical protein
MVAKAGVEVVAQGASGATANSGVTVSSEMDATLAGMDS